jgi:flap endonuclease-1
MGIKKLFALIKDYAADAVREVPIERLRGRTVGIDASIFVYQWYSVGKTRQIKNKAGKLVNHIYGAFFRTIRLLLAGITPIYVFDNKPPPAKIHAINRRDNLNRAQVPRQAFDEVMLLLDLMGVDYIVAGGEADAQLGYLAKKDYINAVASEDLDLLVFGADYLIRGLNATSTVVSVIDRKKLLNDLHINAAQFLDLCILLGCDYTATIPGVGYKTALRLIRTHGNIESIIRNSELEIPAEFDYRRARAEFTRPRISSFQRRTRPKLTSSDISKLHEYLVVAHGLEHRRITGGLKKLANWHHIGRGSF